VIYQTQKMTKNAKNVMPITKKTIQPTKQIIITKQQSKTKQKSKYYFCK